MLISHVYKFIFIKTKKTAGTSIEVELSKIMGRKDIVTPISPKEDGHISRNFRTLRGKFFNHIDAFSVLKILGEQKFHSYYKFCVEREPVDKCISYYSMLRNSPHHNRNSKQIDWDTYVLNRDFPIDTDKYTDNSGNLLVDRILRYENLEDELAEISSHLGLPFAGLQAKAKSGFREHVPVTNAHREAIYDAFRDSLRFTGYDQRAS